MRGPGSLSYVAVQDKQDTSGSMGGRSVDQWPGTAAYFRTRLGWSGFGLFRRSARRHDQLQHHVKASRQMADGGRRPTMLAVEGGPKLTQRLPCSFLWLDHGN